MKEMMGMTMMNFIDNQERDETPHAKQANDNNLPEDFTQSNALEQMRSTGRGPRERALTHQTKGQTLKKTGQIPTVSKQPSKISGGFGESDMFDAERAPSESQVAPYNHEMQGTFGDSSSLNGPRDDSAYSQNDANKAYAQYMA